ncbi:CapA family protein [Priestia taiwanensis]
MSGLFSQSDSPEAVATKEEQTETSKEETKEKAVTPGEEPEITLTFSGDTMFDWGLRPVIAKHGADYPFQHVKSEVEKADYSFVNLESTFTTRSEKFNGQLFWIKSDPSTLQAVKNTGFDLVNLGHNHSLDYLEEGLVDSITHVEEAGFDYIGAGRNEEEAYKPKEVEIKGKKFKFFTFVRFYPDYRWVATKDKPGVPNGYDLDLLIEKINEQKGDADYVIVYMHWGIEKTNTPAPYQKEYVKRMVEEAGVDAIVGSHPHWLQGFEYYNGVPVAYSLGNFLFPDYVKGHSAETGVLTLKAKGDKIDMSFNPYMIRNNQISPVEGKERTKMLKYLQSVSPKVTIDEDGNVTAKEGT